MGWLVTHSVKIHLEVFDLRKIGCHPVEGRDPFLLRYRWEEWVPAFAGMTIKRLVKQQDDKMGRGSKINCKTCFPPLYSSYPRQHYVKQYRAGIRF